VRPAIATVIGPGWEPRLVEHARSSGLARLIGRCSDPAGLAELVARADVVFVGSDVPWLPDTDLRTMADHTRLIGVAGDDPGARLLGRMGVQDIIAAATPPGGMLALAVSQSATERGRLIEVTGTRGAPGRSEIALGLAYAWRHRGGAALLELDDAAPSLGLRMELPPGIETHRLDGVSLMPSPVGVGPRRVDLLATTITESTSHHTITILDGGPGSTWHRMVPVDEVVLVGEATDVGVVRLAHMCEAWLGPTPRLVINRHRPGQQLGHVRQATGLEPAAVIPELPPPTIGSIPGPRLHAALRTLVGQRTAL
jgi:hypothetical protein